MHSHFPHFIRNAYVALILWMLVRKAEAYCSVLYGTAPCMNTQMGLIVHFESKRHCNV